MPFLESVDIPQNCVKCPFDPLTGRSSLGNLRCFCVSFFSFVNVIRFSWDKRYSFLMLWLMWHYAALVWQGLYGPVTRVPRGKPTYEKRMPLFGICWNAIHVRFILWLDVHHQVTCVVRTCYFSPLSTSFVSDTSFFPHKLASVRGIRALG